MGDNHSARGDEDDVYVARRAALDEQYRTLPSAGSAQYWRLIEATGAQTPMPLEVLARCIHERPTTAAIEDAQRIFTSVMLRLQDTTRHWARLIAKQAHSGMRPQLQEDLEQEAYLKLWEDLADEGPTFLLENFTFAYSRLRQHVAQSVMERAGERQRPGAAQSNRVPRAQIDSLQKERPGEDEPLYTTQLADASAQEAFEGAELSDLLAVVNSLPVDDRTLILDRFWNDTPQEETAAKLGISGRMVRYRLKAILHELGVRYRGDEEDHHG